MKFNFLYTIVILILSFSISSNQITNNEGTITYIGNLKEEACNYLICPSNKGYCKAEKCICFTGYLTFIDDSDSNPRYCSYKQKASLTALLLEAFGGIGFGHGYAGRIFYGVLKLICFYLIICLGTQFVIQFLKENIETDLAYYIKIGTSTGCIGTPLVWHFIDLYKWANNSYLDGNDMPGGDW